jgi:hypothetical protein
MARQGFEYLFAEHLADKTHVAVHPDAPTVRNGDSAGFLAPMLERK